MKIQLFDEDDFKGLENALFRAIVRALRVVVREELVTGYKVPVETKKPELEAPPPPPPPPPPAPVAVAPPPVPVMTKKQRAPRRSPREVCKTVAERPDGYITTDQALELLGRSGTVQSNLSRWVLDGEIPAVIVAGFKPPTKGLPGRLMIDKQALLKRDAQRVANVTTAPMLKRWGQKAVA